MSGNIFFLLHNSLIMPDKEQSIFSKYTVHVGLMAFGVLTSLTSGYLLKNGIETAATLSECEPLIDEPARIICAINQYVEASSGSDFEWVLPTFILGIILAGYAGYQVYQEAKS